MSDSYGDGSIGGGSNADYGIPASTAPTSPSSGPSSSTLLGLGALGVGAAGFGSILAQGESPLPGEFSQLTAGVPDLQNEAKSLEATGASFTSQGADALKMAQNGQLTAPQQAQLDQYSSGLKNTAQQTYASMGRNINQDTSGISTQADIDAKVNAMAQQEIQSTIAIGLGETSAGANFSGQALGFENAANSALIAAGTAQIAQDKSYSDSLTSSFSSIAKLFGSIGGALIGGPAGAAIGGAAGSLVK